MTIGRLFHPQLLTQHDVKEVHVTSTVSDKRELAKLIAGKFIARPDVKAYQQTDGSYRPDRTKISMQDLVDHLDGKFSMGHYMVSPDDQVKLFAFDIDLNKEGELPQARDSEGVLFKDFQPCNPREVWRSRQRGPARDYIRLGFHTLAHRLADCIQDELGIQTAVTYSGSKGVHVYGFTGPTTAELARRGAAIVLEATGRWKLLKGKNFFKYEDPWWTEQDKFDQFTLEVYPKQDTLADKDLGNLMRLPLGRNLRSPKDPTFFLDLRCALTEFEARDPIEALTTTNIFA